MLKIKIYETRGRHSVCKTGKKSSANSGGLIGNNMSCSVSKVSKGLSTTK